MRLLIIGGANKKWMSLEIYYHKYLNEYCQCEIFPIQNQFVNYYSKNIFNKIIFKIGLSDIYLKLNDQLKIKINDFKPDILFVFKGMEVLPKTLAFCKKKGIFLVNYNPDNPFIFSGKGSGNKNITNSINLYDLHFTYSTAILKQLAKRTHSATHYLPFGFDIDNHLLEIVQQQQEVLRTCFLGNPDVYRAAFIKKLGDAGVLIDVYGHGWNKFIQHANISVFPAVYADEFWKTLYKYRIQLNLMRPHNEYSHNMRTFEVPGVGGIGLFPENEEHLGFFEKGKEVFLYQDFYDCLQHINTLLSLPKTEADAIRAAARKKCLEHGYSYQSRVQYVYELFTRVICTRQNG